MQPDPPDLAHALRQSSLRISTRLLTAMFGIGCLLGLKPLIAGDDSMAFFAPLLVFVCSAVAARDSQAGREDRARVIFAATMYAYLAILMGFAPEFLRVSIGFPVCCLTLLLFHLIYTPQRASQLGWGVLGVVGFGFAALALQNDAFEWQLRTSCAVQLLVLSFANFVLSRLGRGWAEALSEANLARLQASGAYELALEASQAKSRFLASMSHELRTPLNAVIGYAELADEQLASDGTAERDDLQRIQRAGSHLLDLVNQVLDLSRIEAGRLQLERTPVCLADVAREVCDTLRPQIRRNHNQLVLETRQLAPLQLDRLRTKQILTNLLSNAAKFTDHGTISVCLRQRDDAVVLTVSDDGPGIPADRLEQVFEPFAQASDAVQRTHGGTGLGLAISRRLTREMGGDLTVHSSLGQGATFEVVFPACEPAAGAPHLTLVTAA